MSEKIRIVLSGIFYPVAILRYFENALLRRDDVELFTVGPYTGTWIPWAGGMNLSAKYAKKPDLPLAGDMARIGKVPYGVVSFLPWVPDLWLQVDAGFYFDFGGKYNTQAGRVAHVATDPHVLDYSYQRTQCHQFFNMQKIYSQPGDIYLPYAADPEWHAPIEGLEKEYDACLIGLHYESRTRLVDALRQKGLRVYYDIGPAFREYQLLYARSKVALSWSSKQDLIARVFEAMAMKIPLVCNIVPDLDLHFKDGVHYHGFRGLGDAIKEVEEIVGTHRNAAEKMAQQAHDLVMEKHTYDHRIQQILETCGVL